MLLLMLLLAVGSLNMELMHCWIGRPYPFTHCYLTYMSDCVSKHSCKQGYICILNGEWKRLGGQMGGSSTVADEWQLLKYSCYIVQRNEVSSYSIYRLAD